MPFGVIAAQLAACELDTADNNVNLRYKATERYSMAFTNPRDVLGLDSGSKPLILGECKRCGGPRRVEDRGTCRYCRCST